MEFVKAKIAYFGTPGRKVEPGLNLSNVGTHVRFFNEVTDTIAGSLGAIG